MAEPFQPHVGDVGTVLRMSIVELPPGVTDPTLAQPVNLSTATNIQFVLTSPTKRRFVVDAGLNTDGIDGKLAYVVESGDLDVAGKWKMQALFTMGAASFSSDIITFGVSPNL